MDISLLSSVLRLSFINDNRKTRTRMGVKKNINRIVVTNADPENRLVVVFSPRGKIEWEDGKPLKDDKLDLKPNESATVKFGKPAVGESVGYTAQIAGTIAEDPIVIID